MSILKDQINPCRSLPNNKKQPLYAKSRAPVWGTHSSGTLYRAHGAADKHTHTHIHQCMHGHVFFVCNYVIRMHFCMYVNIHRVYIHTHTAQNTHTSTLTSHKTLKISSIMSHILSLLVQSKHGHGSVESCANFHRVVSHYIRVRITPHLSFP